MSASVTFSAKHPELGDVTSYGSTNPLSLDELVVTFDGDSLTTSDPGAIQMLRNGGFEEIAAAPTPKAAPSPKAAKEQA